MSCLPQHWCDLLFETCSDHIIRNVLGSIFNHPGNSTKNRTWIVGKMIKWKRKNGAGNSILDFETLFFEFLEWFNGIGLNRQVLVVPWCCPVRTLEVAPFLNMFTFLNLGQNSFLILKSGTDASTVRSYFRDSGTTISWSDSHLILQRDIGGTEDIQRRNFEKRLILIAGLTN